MTLKAEQIVKDSGEGPASKEARGSSPLLSRLPSLSLEKSRTFVRDSEPLASTLVWSTGRRLLSRDVKRSRSKVERSIIWGCTWTKIPFLGVKNDIIGSSRTDVSSLDSDSIWGCWRFTPFLYHTVPFKMSKKRARHPAGQPLMIVSFCYPEN